MLDANIFVQNDNRNGIVCSNHYENITDVELDLSKEDIYQTQSHIGDEYVVHENNPDEDKEKDGPNMVSELVRNSHKQKYDNNNIYLQQIPQRNKCSVRIQEGDTYEHENIQVSENPNPVFVTLAKRKSHGRHVSFFMQLYKSCVCRKCLWTTFGLILTLLIISAISTGYYLSPRKIKAECMTSKTAKNFTDLRGVDITINVSDLNRKCVFPFEYKKKLYYKCTNDYFSCPSCYWCGTQLNVSYYSGWGMCNKSCPKETSAKEKSTKPPPSCVDERKWCKNVNKKKCDNTIYDNDPTRDDLYKDICKKLCNNC